MAVNRWNPLDYLKLYRIDVFVVTNITAVCGYYFSHGTVRPEAAYAAIFISSILYNYVYVLNAITDIGADRINKPERPLPSGKIPYRSAIIYLLFLILLSIGGILYLFRGFNMEMGFLVLVIGGIYSVPPFELKNIPLLAPFITGWGVVHPIFITGEFSKVAIPAAILTCYATGTTLLKDLSDIEGDRQAGRRVVTDFISIRGLLGISMAMTLLAALLCLNLDDPVIGLAPLSTFLLTMYHALFIAEAIIKKKIYRRMTLSVAVVGSAVLTIVVI